MLFRLGRNLESISAVFPAYNDGGTIGELVEKIHQLLETTGRDYEIVVVDDGSKDNTAAVLQSCQAKFGSRLRVVTHPQNRGYGAALRSGFKAARKELVFYTDGDGQYDPSELSLLLPKMTSSIDLVNGYKIKRHDPLYRIVVGKAYNRFVRLAFRLQVRDVDCDFRLVRRELLNQCNLESDSGVICVEMVHKLQRLGCRLTEVPVHHYPRLVGSSQFFRFRAVTETLLQLFHLFRRRSAPIGPLPQEVPGTRLK